MTPIRSDDDSLANAPSAVEHEGTLAGAVSRLPEVSDVNFGIKHIGGGYDRAEVDAFLHDLSEVVSDIRTAMDSGRQELTNLRAENARLRAAAGADIEQEIAAGAVGLLSQAQLIADRAVADAEQYARDLVVAARDEYREVLERAERTAGHVVAGLATAEGPTLPEIEYVRTYAKVAQIQLRSVLDALTEQVDRLGTVRQPDEEVAEPSIAQPSIPDDEPVGEPDWSRPVARRGSFVEPETFSMPGPFTEAEFSFESESSSEPEAESSSEPGITARQ
jgi:cell division septum initiation protein DivIVA